MTQWTVRRYGAHPRNQVANEHMLALVEAPDRATAERVLLELPGVTLYPGQYFRITEVRPERPAPRRVQRALNANTMRERLVDGYDDWVVSQGRVRFYVLHPSQRAAEKRRLAAIAEAVPSAKWLDRETAWLLRQRDTGRLIYVVGTGVWRTVTDDGHDFARWLCGAYRNGAKPVMACQTPETHGSAGWCPLRDRSYDAVAIARRVGEDRVKLIVLDGDEHWFDNDARPASPAILRPRFDAMGRKIGYERME
jgi:hypothetical protein